MSGDDRQVQEDCIEEVMSTKKDVLASCYWYWMSLSMNDRQFAGVMMLLAQLVVVDYL